MRNERLTLFDHVYRIANRYSDDDYEGAILDRGQLVWVYETLAGRSTPDIGPIVVTHHSGPPIPKDIFWASLVGGPIVSQRVLDLLTSSGMTGWTTYPVRVFAQDETELEGFSGLRSRSRTGPVDFTKGERVPASYNPKYFLFRGGTFDVATWDGSDIFTSGKSMQLLVVERVKTAFERASINEVLFLRLSQIEMSEPLAKRELGIPWWDETDANEEEATNALFSEPWWKRYGDSEEEAQRDLGWIK